MLACGRDWQPTEIRRVIHPILSSTCVVSVMTDEGAAYLKGMGNPAGNGSLALELVGSELADAVGLKVPSFSVVDLAGIEILTAKGGRLNFGPAFVSKAVRGSPGDADGVFVRKLSNPQDVPLLVAFDTWIRNLDRCPPTDYFDPTPNRDNLFFAPSGNRFELMAIDHTHCFVEGDIEAAFEDNHFVDDHRVYGAFPEFAGHLSEAGLRAAAEAITEIDPDRVEQIVGSVPIPWGVSSAVRIRWAEQIVARAKRIEEYLLAGLISQAQMGL